MHLVFTFALLLLATVASAGEPAKTEFVTIPEVDALRLEKSEAVYQTVQAEIRALQERGERIREQVIRYVQDLQRALNCPNCQIDLAHRRLMKPLEPKSEAKPEPKGE